MRFTCLLVLFFTASHAFAQSDSSKSFKISGYLETYSKDPIFKYTQNSHGQTTATMALIVKL
jgi:hypothetical protein